MCMQFASSDCWPALPENVINTKFLGEGKPELERGVSLPLVRCPSPLCRSVLGATATSNYGGPITPQEVSLFHY